MNKLIVVLFIVNLACLAANLFYFIPEAKRKAEHGWHTTFVVLATLNAVAMLMNLINLFRN